MTKELLTERRDVIAKELTALSEQHAALKKAIADCEANYHATTGRLKEIMELLEKYVDPAN